MRRFLLVFAGLLLLFVGATAAWFAMSIPNDMRAQGVMRKAREQLKAGKRDEARASFETILREYPRTDAAATALAAVFRMIDEDRRRLEEQLTQLRTANEERLRRTETTASEAVETSKQAVEVAAKPPPPKPTIAVKKSTTKKKSAPPPRRRRR